MTPSLERLAQLVRGRMDEGVALQEACVWVVAEIHLGGDELFDELVRDHGAQIVRHLVNPLVSSRAHGKAATERRAYGGAPAPSWREGMRDRPGSVLEIELPVGPARTMKRVADLTPGDVLLVEEMYRGLANQVTSRAEQWGRVRRRMKGSDTIAAAVEAGRLLVSELTYIGGPQLLVVAGEAAD